MSQDDRPRVILLVGLPGSGKSTWVSKQNHAASISSDEIRWLLSDDRTNQTIHRAVFAIVRCLLRKRLELGRPVTYIDATNVTPRDRRGYIKLGELYDARVEAVYFDTPVEVCKARNRLRDRVVPEWAIDAMAERMTVPSLEEGFASVTVYRAEEAEAPLSERESPLPRSES